MPFVKTPNLNVHYEQAGAGKDTLLLIHGNFASWRWWKQTIDRLPPNFLAYAPDLRGCGDTDKPSNGYTIEQLSDDLYGFVKALNLPSFHLVGHSLGGAVVLQFALDHLDQIRTLTLVAPAPANGMSLLSNKMNDFPLLEHLFEDFQRERILLRIETLNQFLRSTGANRSILRRALMKMAPSLDDDEAFDALVDDACRMAPEALIGFLQALDRWSVEKDLWKLRLPVLILLGSQDILISKSALKRTVKGLPHANLMLWKDVGHSPQLEQPDRFVQLLRGFINRGYARPSIISSVKKRVLNFFQEGKLS